MPRITLKNKILQVQKGEKLADVLIRNGVFVDRPCGGKGICGKCTVIVSGQAQLSCQYVIEDDIEIVLPDNDAILSETGIEKSGYYTENMCFALDIGTSTLALALVCLDDCTVVDTLTRTNPQKVYGADIISRIEFCRKASYEPLHKILIDEINAMIETFCLKKEIPMFVSGNTTMLHLFFGIDPSSMGVAPYTPVFLEKQTANGSEIGLKTISRVESLPCVSPFVGADIVAGLNYIGINESNKYNLLIDLGTNAEIALFSESDVICTSAAAGPCFEGANISCGMSATKGAVCAYSKDGCRTVEDAVPKGICGTGLIDIIAELLDSQIDETGFMESEIFEIADGVSVSQLDVRQYQLAKSAVFSAIETLLKLKQLSHNDIEKVYISGGFSSGINISNAVKTGVIPKEFEDKCVSLKNSSLSGTIKYICGNDETEKILKNAEYVDLSSSDTFSQLFIENMMF